MATPDAFAAALAAEPNFDQRTVRAVTDDLTPAEGGVSADRDEIAHALWANGVYVDHLGECRAEEEFSIYTNACAPCEEYMLGVADRVLGRITLGVPADVEIDRQS